MPNGIFACGPGFVDADEAAEAGDHADLVRFDLVVGADERDESDEAGDSTPQQARAGAQPGPSQAGRVDERTLVVAVEAAV